MNHFTRRPHNIEHVAKVMEEHYLCLIVEARVWQYALLIQKNKIHSQQGFFSCFQFWQISN